MTSPRPSSQSSATPSPASAPSASSPILRRATAAILPILLLFAAIVIVQGHNKPGGGFIGGLIAATGFALVALAYSVERARRTLRVAPGTLIAVGLLLALASALPAVVRDQPVMTGLWIKIPLPDGDTLKLGTPLLFDLGVALLVLGVGTLMVFSLADQPRRAPSRAGGHP